MKRLIALSLMWSVSLPGWSQSIQFADEALPSIATTGSVAVSATGDLSVSCSSASSCQALAGGGTAPTVVLSVGATATVNTPVTATLSSSGSPAACVGTASPAVGVTGWVGLALPASGTRSVTFNAPGAYTLGYQCFNAAGSSAVAQKAVTASGGGGTTDPYACVIDGVTISGTTRPTGYELIRPVSGWRMHDMTWESQFNGRPFGTATSYLAPIGSFSVDEDPAAGMYITIPFTPTAGRIYNIGWQSAQSIPDAGYYTPRLANVVHVSVSPCAGDLRARVSTSTNQWLKACKKSGGAQGSLTFADVEGAACRLQAGQKYWLTILMADPSDGLSNTENSCAQSRTQCEANFSHSATGQ